MSDRLKRIEQLQQENQALRIDNQVYHERNLVLRHEITRLREALKLADKEIREHSSEYHHVTSDEVFDQISKALAPQEGKQE